MRLLNCSLNDCSKIFGGRKIVFFGCGSWLQIINHTPIMEYSSDFLFAIDNGNLKKVSLGGIELDVKQPQAITGMTSIVVVLTSPVYMYDMFIQLKGLNLDDSCICVAFPFMQMISNANMDDTGFFSIHDTSELKIPQIIHSFWFSQDPKTKLYQKCVASWKNRLPDYKIIEWNQDNYDCSGHPFVRRAIEEQAWAFASDYARLDVLYRYGGIYLDMDVEVYKSFDDLLGNDAILSFSNNVQIDLAVVGAKPQNDVIKSLRDLYDNVELPKSKSEFTAFFQPSFVRESLFDLGIKMDGTMQRIDNATIFPKEFFMPQEHILFEPFEMTENTYCVHYDNFGWSFNKDSKREKKIKDNRLLWNEIER